MANVRDAFVCAGDYGSEPIKEFKVTEIEPSPSSRMIGSPVETGTMSFDNKVIDPITVKVVGMCHVSMYDKVYNKFLDMLENREWSFVSVVSKVQTYSKLMLTRMPHRETSDKHDVVEITLEFTQVIEDGKFSNPANPTNANTTNAGLKG